MVGRELGAEKANPEITIADDVGSDVGLRDLVLAQNVDTSNGEGFRGACQFANAINDYLGGGGDMNQTF